MASFLILPSSICIWLHHVGLQRTATERNNFSMENVLSGFSRLNSSAMKQSNGYIYVTLIDRYA
jgi:hypothetical protein